MLPIGPGRASGPEDAVVVGAVGVVVAGTRSGTAPPAAAGAAEVGHPRSTFGTGEVAAAPE